jgi:hypothetical protein
MKSSRLFLLSALVVPAFLHAGLPGGGGGDGEGGGESGIVGTYSVSKVGTEEPSGSTCVIGVAEPGLGDYSLEVFNERGEIAYRGWIHGEAGLWQWDATRKDGTAVSGILYADGKGLICHQDGARGPRFLRPLS